MNTRGLSSLLFRCVALGCGALVLPSTAADPVLVDEALALEARVHTLERSAAPSAQLALFVGSGDDALRLRKVVLRLDDQPQTVYEYAAPEWEALHAGALHAALQVSLAPGPRRLRLQLFARGRDAEPGDPRTIAHLDQVVDLGPGATYLLARLEQPRFGRAALALRSVDAAAAGDAWQRAARFHLDADRPYAAAQLITRLQAGGEPLPEAAALLSQSRARMTARGTAPANAALEAYNAAATAAAAGDLAALETIGEAQARSADAWTLRDRANLLLGYAHLRRGDGEAAAERFSRVRSPGPHGNAALLGFGWSFLVPPPSSSRAPPSVPGRPAFASAISARPVNTPAPSKDRRHALERALVPWTELIGRDPLDLDAQEGLLALAWALDQLGTGTQSHRFYERAVAQLEQARGLLDRAMEQVGSGQTARAVAAAQDDPSSGWTPWLAEMSYADDTAYLKVLLDDPALVGLLDDYRGARRLREDLDRCAERLARLPRGAAQDDTETRLQAARTRAQQAETPARLAFERAALDLLRTRKQQIERYLVEARLALARHFDSAPPADPSSAAIAGARS